MTETTGAKGDKGDRGERGEQGERGEKGDRGEKGEKGDRGDRGERGEKGERGDRGDRGEKGEKGNRGEKGERGPPGPPGPSVRIRGLFSNADIDSLTAGQKARLDSELPRAIRAVVDCRDGDGFDSAMRLLKATMNGAGLSVTEPGWYGVDMGMIHLQQAIVQDRSKPLGERMEAKIREHLCWTVRVTSRHGPHENDILESALAVALYRKLL